MGYLWKDILEDEGHTVEIKEMADNAPLYTALSDGDVDLMPSAWPEVTHAQYMEKFEWPVRSVDSTALVTARFRR